MCLWFAISPGDLFQRVTYPGRQAQPIGQNPPFAPGAARQIDSINLQIASLRRDDAVHLARKMRAPGDDGGGQVTIPYKGLGPINIGNDLLQQGGALDQLLGQARPLFRPDQQRHRANGPGSFVRLARQAKSHAKISGFMLQALMNIAQSATAQLRQSARHPPPVIGNVWGCVGKQIGTALRDRIIAQRIICGGG